MSILSPVLGFVRRPVIQGAFVKLINLVPALDGLNYFRPDGTSSYLRPDGTSLYKRP